MSGQQHLLVTGPGEQTGHHWHGAGRLVDHYLDHSYRASLRRGGQPGKLGGGDAKGGQCRRLAARACRPAQDRGPAVRRAGPRRPPPHRLPSAARRSRRVRRLVDDDKRAARIGAEPDSGPADQR